MPKVSVFFKAVEREDIGRILPFPAYKKGMDVYSSFVPGEIRMMEIKNPRNAKFHRLYFAILRMVVANSERWRSVDHLRHALMIHLGLYDVEVGVNGVQIPMVHSISFDTMDEDEFRQKVFDPSMNVLSEITGIVVGDLINPDNWEEYAQ